MFFDWENDWHGRTFQVSGEMNHKTRDDGAVAPHPAGRAEGRYAPPFQLTVCLPTRLAVCFQPACSLAGREERGVVAPSSRSSAASWAIPATHFLPPPRAAGRAIRPLRGEITCSFLFMTRRVVAAVRRVKGGDGESEQGLRAQDGGVRRTTTRR